MDAADQKTAEALGWAVQKETDRGSASGMSRRVSGVTGWDYGTMWGPKKDSVQLGRL